MTAPQPPAVVWMVRDLPWRVICWLYGHKTIALGPSPPEGWWCWRCYQAIHQNGDDHE